jgi:hypothetical protein
MKRLFFLLSSAVACCTGNPEALAGGWCGGGCWGGHGCYVGCWPFLGVGIGPCGIGINVCGIGIGVGGCYPPGGYCSYYPGYTYPSHPVAYSQPVYVHPANQAYVSAAAPAIYTVRYPVANPVYARALPAPREFGSQPSSPALSTTVVAVKAQAPASRVALTGRGTWVLDTSPDCYRPSSNVPEQPDSRSFVKTAPKGQPPVYVAVR